MSGDNGVTGVWVWKCSAVASSSCVVVTGSSVTDVRQIVDGEGLPSVLLSQVVSHRTGPYILFLYDMRRA